MGVVIPQVVTEDRASGAQIVDGGLRFDRSKTNIVRKTFSSSGNRKTWTLSFWHKVTDTSNAYNIFTASRGSSTRPTFEIAHNYGSSGNLVLSQYNGSGYDIGVKVDGLYRDTNAWYHFVIVVDTTQSTDSNRVKVYVNGTQRTVTATAGGSVWPSLNADLEINNGVLHNISANAFGDGNPMDGYVCLMYMVDGQALDPSYFGYTDALTNVWRPKKFKPQATPNNGTTWSTSGNFSGSVRSQGDSYGPPNMFNGIIGNENTSGAVCFAPYSSNSTCTWTAPTTFTGLTSLRLYVDLSGSVGKLTVNGTDYSSLVTALSSGDGWITIPQTSLSTISFGYTNGINDATGIAAVEVNGVILLDNDVTNMGKNAFYLPFDGSAPIGQDQSGRGNNWTPVNFGGSNTIEKATGALPILNTDGGGKVARVGVRTDANASSLVLALPLVGIKSDFSNAVNSGTSNKAITANGNAAASSTKSNFYGGSFYFDGTGDYLTISSSSDLTFGTGDFTLEYWINTTDTNFNFMHPESATGSGYWGHIIQNSSFNWNDAYNSSNLWNVNATPILDGNWHHCAICRASGVTKVFFDGVSQSASGGTFTDSTNYSGTTAWEIGGSGNLGDFAGYLQDLRIYKGLAKYTSNFIPASTDPDIVPDSPSGVSYSSNLTQITDGAVAFDGSGDYLSLASNTDFEIGSGDYTLETFVYGNSWLSSNGGSGILGKGNVTSLSGEVYTIQINNGTVQYYVFNSTGTYNTPLVSSTSTLSTGSWHHIAISRSGNNTRLFVNGVLQSTSTENYTVTSGGQVVIGTQAYDPGSSGRSHTGFISNLNVVKGTALYTSNFTPPSAPISSVANTKLLCCKSNSITGAFDVAPTSGINNGTIWSEASTITYDGTPDTTYTTGQTYSMFDDSTSTGFGVNNGATAKFINIVFPSPITLTTSLRVYATFRTGMQWKVNGSNVSSSGVSHPNVGWQTLTGWSSGTISSLRNDCPNGNALEIYAIEIDGVILKDPLSRFGNTAATNFNPFTANINTQRGKQSGYATLNPLSYTGTMTFSNGNLNVSGTAVNASSNIAVRSGKWYAEFVYSTIGSTVGLVAVSNKVTADALYGATQTWQLGYTSSGKLENASSQSNTSTFTTGDVVSIAFDCSTGTATFYKNGISVGSVTNSSFANVDIVIGGGAGGANGSDAYAANFGQKPFKFPPPAGFQPLTLANTPRPTIVRPDQYVGIVTYTGTGAARSLNVGFKPDFVWIKDRSNGYNHVLFDSVRGTGGSKVLFSNRTTAEGGGTGEEGTVYGHVSSFDTYGFSVSPGSGSPLWVSSSGDNYVAWTWKAGGNSNTYNINDVGYATTTAAGLTAGNSNLVTGASVNTKSGFSIITYSSSTTPNIPHGLGRNVSFIIAKSRNNAQDWVVYHRSLGKDKVLVLNGTGGEISVSNYWGTSEPNDTVFGTYGTGSNSNNQGNMVAYCWAEIPGFSKFGSYTGNGSADGPMVITGFRPKYILVKASSTGGSFYYWWIYDAARSTYNPTAHELSANTSEAEGSGYQFDLLSNGFKVRTNAIYANSSGATFIYAAFAESPAINLYGAQANAR